MNSLFGVELPTPVKFVIAFVVVLALIGVCRLGGAPLRRRRGLKRPAAAASRASR